MWAVATRGLTRSTRHHPPSSPKAAAAVKPCCFKVPPTGLVPAERPPREVQAPMQSTPAAAAAHPQLPAPAAVVAAVAERAVRGMPARRQRESARRRLLVVVMVATRILPSAVQHQAKSRPCLPVAVAVVQDPPVQPFKPAGLELMVRWCWFIVDPVPFPWTIP